MLPQMVEFTNRIVIALSSAFPPQLFSDSTPTTSNPAQVLAISGVSQNVGGNTVTITFATTPSPALPLGSNILLQNVTDPTFDGVFVVLSVSGATATVRNIAPAPSATSSAGTATVTTTPIVNTFVPAYPIWTASTTFDVGSIIQPATQPSPAIYLIAIQGGTTGTAEPSWTGLSQGQNIQESAPGSVVWQDAGLLNLAAPPPPGAAHITVYAGSLWVLNTFPTNTASGIDGPTSLRMSSINNPNSWNPINQAFLDKDDGTVGMGLATFTITAQGIPPEGSMVAYKLYQGYQIVGVFGASNFAIQRVQSDMGCNAPRSIQFLTGFGIARSTHLGIGVFDGVNDRIISEPIRPYLLPSNDQDDADITVVDASWLLSAWGAQAANPPMYTLFVPIGNSGGQLTRALCFDMVLKAWAITDLPFSVSTALQVRSGLANPTTVLGDFSDGILQRWQSGDLQWYTGGTPQDVDWLMVTGALASKDASQRVYVRRVAVTGINTAVSSAGIQVITAEEGNPQPVVSFVTPAVGDFTEFATVQRVGTRFNTQISGAGQVEIDNIEFHIEPRPSLGVGKFLV